MSVVLLSIQIFVDNNVFVLSLYALNSFSLQILNILEINICVSLKLLRLVTSSHYYNHNISKNSQFVIKFNNKLICNITILFLKTIPADGFSNYWLFYYQIWLKLRNFLLSYNLFKVKMKLTNYCVELESIRLY